MSGHIENFASERGITISSVDVLGTPIYDIDPHIFLQLLSNFFESEGSKPRGKYVVFRDVHGVVRARDEADLNVAHHSSLVNAPDGVPLVWVARLLGLKRISRVCGPDMMLEVCRNGIDKGWRHVLFGSTPETLAKLKESLQRQFPSLQIVDAISPAFGVVSSEEREAQVDRIRRAQPHFVWVGLGSPKQEVWMAQNASSLPGSLCMGVGAAFDMHAGRIRRAPNWMRGIGVEWLYRITQDPSRLINRYAKVVPRFLALITVALAQHGFNNAKSRLFGARQAG